MTGQPHKSNIDYIRDSGKLINRPGRVWNIITGCNHHATGICKVPCYAKRLVATRLRGNPAYPYGFAPTFHTERIHPVGKRSKWLIFLNDMGDVGGNWWWNEYRSDDSAGGCTPKVVAHEMARFASLNATHICLLLTKNPAWYGLIEKWPENVWCGFTATTQEELESRYADMSGIDPAHTWVSLEPWYGLEHPVFADDWFSWVVIGGQTGPDKPVSEATIGWLHQPSTAPRFVKRNAYHEAGTSDQWIYDYRYLNADLPREYPAEWRVGGHR